MVRIEPSLKRKVNEFVKRHGLTYEVHQGIDQVTTDVEEQSTFREEDIPEEYREMEIPGLNMTYSELRKAVDEYGNWLEAVNDLVEDTKLDIKTLTNQFENLTGEAKKQVAYELQNQEDALEDYEDERAEVRAKHQLLTRKLTRAERDIRRDMRERNLVEWDQYDSAEAREQARKDEKERQKEMQGVRAVRRDLSRETTTEKPDMSNVKEIGGEDVAEEVARTINEDIKADNPWGAEEDEEKHDSDRHTGMR